MLCSPHHFCSNTCKRSPSYKASYLTHTQPRLLQFHCQLWRYAGLHQARTPIITATCGGSGPISWTFPSQCCSAWDRAVWMCLGDVFSRERDLHLSKGPSGLQQPSMSSFFSVFCWTTFLICSLTELLSLPTLLPSCFSITLCSSAPSSFFVFLG